VDYLIRKNPDGSVSCFVGSMDLPSRTQWRVQFTIPPDKAYLEARSLWYNPQPLNQSYYVWMNVAEKVGKDLEVLGLYRERSGEGSFWGRRALERRSVFDTTT
jgi:hypothetical protein